MILWYYDMKLLRFLTFAYFDYLFFLNLALKWLKKEQGSDDVGMINFHFEIYNFKERKTWYGSEGHFLIQM